MTRLRGVLLIAVKVLISAALFWYAFSKVDVGNALRLLGSAHPGLVAGAIAALAVQQILGGARLHRLLRALGAPIRLLHAIDAVFVGLFFGTTFVSFLSGDAMRVWRLTRARIPVSSAVQAILFDRVLGFVALMGIIAVTVPVLSAMTANRAMVWSVFAVAAAGLSGSAAFLLLHRVPRLPRRWPLVRRAADVSAAAFQAVARPRDLAYLLGLSAALQSLNVLGMYAIALGLGVEARLIDFLVIVPPVMLVTMLPISFAGWGVRESAMVVGMGLVGVGQEQSVAISVGFGLSMMAVGLPGGAIWFVAQRGAAARPVPASS